MKKKGKEIVRGISTYKEGESDIRVNRGQAFSLFFGSKGKGRRDEPDQGGERKGKSNVLSE